MLLPDCFLALSVWSFSCCPCLGYNKIQSTQPFQFCVKGRTLFSAQWYLRHHGSRAALRGEFKVMNVEIWPAVNHDKKMQVPQTQNVLTQRKQFAPQANVQRPCIHAKQTVHNDTTGLTSESKIYNWLSTTAIFFTPAEKTIKTKKKIKKHN